MSCVTEIVNNRRRLFWATQPDACGAEALCNSTVSCGTPGLELADGVISTQNWVRGLVINMLMTDGKEPDKACGYLPGAQGGHWSESYIATEATVGTLVRTLPTTGTIAESVATVAAYAEATLYRLVARGVASSVEVVASYAGNMRVAVNVIVYGTNGEVSARVGLSSTRLANGWVWQ